MCSAVLGQFCSYVLRWYSVIFWECANATLHQGSGGNPCDHPPEQSNPVQELEKEIRKLGLEYSRSEVASSLSLRHDADQAFRIPSVGQVSPTAVPIPLREAAGRPPGPTAATVAQQGMARRLVRIFEKYPEPCPMSCMEPYMQKVKGKSGADWEIDAKGRVIGNEMFVIVECRRHTGQGQKQEDLAGLAYRIRDTGAASGIIVSPLPLQEGAKKVADAEGIIEVTLNKDCSTTDFVMQFLNRLMMAMSDRVGVSDSVRAVVTDAEGNVKYDETARVDGTSAVR